MRLGRSLAALVLAVVVAVAATVLAASLWFRDAVYGDRSRPLAPTPVVISRGDTFSQATAALGRAGVLAHPLAFRILARLRGDEGSIEPGEYRFPAHLTSDEVLRRLVLGTRAAKWVTFPEGFTVLEMSRRLERNDLAAPGTFARYALSHGIVIGGVRTRTLEGFLFPSTYLIPLDAPPAQIAHELVAQFRTVLPRNAAARAGALHVTLPEAIVLASLIEREAQVDDERPLMAGVYYNRLRAGMPLEVDATIEYIFPEHHDVITASDLRIDSPYNTYLHGGLPPTPIANPGKASIDAALAPQSSKYLYYVYKGGGRHAFAATLHEHEANVERYLH